MRWKTRHFSIWSLVVVASSAVCWAPAAQAGVRIFGTDSVASGFCWTVCGAPTFVAGLVCALMAFVPNRSSTTYSLSVAANVVGFVCSCGFAVHSFRSAAVINIEQANDSIDRAMCGVVATLAFAVLARRAWTLGNASKPNSS